MDGCARLENRYWNPHSGLHMGTSISSTELPCQPPGILFKEKSSRYLFSHIHLSVMHGKGVCALEQVRGQRTLVGGSIFSFHLLGSQYQTQAIWISSKCLYWTTCWTPFRCLNLNPRMLVVDQREFTISSFPKKLLHSQAIDRLSRNNQI